MKIGIIDNVDIASQEGQVYVDVALGPRNYKDGIEFWQPASNIFVVPSEGDAVIVTQLGAGRFIAMHAKRKSPDFTPPTASEGDIFIGGDANIYIGDPDNATAVADENHTHTESGGGTTGPPDSVTEVQIE